jgi:two-component system OmpR family sensor kinase
VSLRSRLLLATVILVALGLVAADASTFTLLRSSLVGRIDDQLRGARFLFERGPFDGGSGIVVSPGGRGPGGPTGDGERHESLPVTYVAILDASGVVTSEGPYGPGSVENPPALPKGLPGSTSFRGGESSVLVTTGSVDGGLRYRVLASALSSGGTAVVAYPLRDVDATLRKLLVVEGSVTAAVLAAVAALALWLVRLGLKPLTEMEATAADIAAGDLSRRIEHAGEYTEVGRLGRALNVMLEKIESAFAERRASEARLRRFVADASHELRTPLTSIRGYAELFRRGADVRPEDLAKSMRRIEEESTRMGTLVDELLLLARLDQGRPLELGPVDLAAVAADAVADARTIAPDRPISIERPQALEVRGDDARLRQVAANLISNALEHTPERTPVSVRVSTSKGSATLEVSDQGPGLSEEQAAKVFDRFYRVDQARSRDNGGAGLGLSIVAAIVHAHGGIVSVDTAPGGGARFAVTIPVKAPDVEDAGAGPSA